MTSDDKKKFAAIMAALGDAYDTAPTRERIGLYWDALGDLSIDAVGYSARQAIRELKFFPKAAELRDFARTYRPPATATSAQLHRERLMIEDLMPPDEQRRKLAEIAETLNRTLGTSFGVGMENGRPTLAANAAGNEQNNG